MSLIMLLFFLIFLALRVPIAICMGLSAIFFIIFFMEIPLILVAQQMISAVDKFTLMAVPFFIIAGTIMEAGGIAKRIINFSNALVGFLPGGMALVMVVASMLFAGMTGSGVADAAAIGSVMIPSMVRSGYKIDFSGALQATAGILGPLIPPSILMVLFAVAAGTSVGDMLLAGVFPGVLMGIFIMIAALIISLRKGYKSECTFSVENLWNSFVKAIWALLTPVIIIGGIYSGVFTPTESAAVAVLYSLVVGVFVYGDLPVREVPKVMYRSMVLAAAIMVIIATAQGFTFILTQQGLPQLMAGWFMTISSNPSVFMVATIILLLIVGCFIDPGPAILILAPIMTPVAQSFGISPVHYGVVMVVAMCIGLITPPVGLNLFVIAGITKRPVHRIVAEIWPFLIATIIGLIVTAAVPSLSLYLPNSLK